jgi:diacylglycerol kinase family enzyme
MIELTEKMSLDFDVVVVLSGDGGVHEVINGLSKHPDARKALRIPIAQIPTGSANAMCVNTLGPKVFDAWLAVFRRVLTVVLAWVQCHESLPECNQGYAHQITAL